MKEALDKLSSFIIESLENYFYRHGKFVSKNPLSVLLVSSLICCLFGIGLINFRNETNMVKLWLPQDSDFVSNMDWLSEMEPTDASYRFNSLIIRGENVLNPEVIQAMYKTHKDVLEIRTESGVTWDEVCLKVPVVLPVDELTDRREQMDTRRKKRYINGRYKRQNGWNEDEFGDDFDFKTADQDGMEDDDDDMVTEYDPSVVLYPDHYCPYVEAMPRACLERSILELWGDGGNYGEQAENRIMNLTQEDVLDMINQNETVSGIFLTPENFNQYLSGVTRDERGRIVGATGTFMRWFGLSNTTDESAGSETGFDIPVDKRTLEFEKGLLEVLDNKCHLPDSVETAGSVMRQYGDVSNQTIWNDVVFLTVGYFIIYGFVQAMLGKWNRVEQRAALAAVGISSTGLAIIGSFGLCSAIGLPFGPMHSLVPCLMVGLSIDDMFVLVQAWNNQPTERSQMDLSQRIGLTMMEAGVGITVTSITDVMVFLIGGTTVLPSLRSYSIYTGVGIIFTYFLQITFFLAAFTLDQKRILQLRDGMFCCKKYPNIDLTKEESILRRVFSSIGKIMEKLPTKIFVILFSLGLAGVSGWGFSCIPVELDYLGFLPSDSSLVKWFKWDEELFPRDGELGSVYLGKNNMVMELDKLDSLMNKFTSNSAVVKSIEGSWYPPFKQYVNTHFRSNNQPIPEVKMEEEEFNNLLTQFLFSPNGSRYQNNFKFNGALVCGEPAPSILVSSVQFTHPKLDTGYRGQHVKSMKWVKEQVNKANFNTTAFPMAQAYSRWEIDEVISYELIRNVLLALAMVSITTLLLLADLLSCLLVLFCLVITLLDVVGLMYFWGLTIDIVAGTNIIISVGLCVDYSAHMAHSFLTQTGSGNERMKNTLKQMGPAVFNGGFSTLLAIIMLVNSKSHVFVSFFKVFFLMIVIGLFHGLILLPTLLSLFTPGPYRHYSNSGKVKKITDNHNCDYGKVTNGMDKT